MTEIERLTAIDAIRQMRSRYLRLLDTRQFDELVTFYTPDATLQFPTEAPGMVFRGHDGIRQMLSAMLDDITTVHHGHLSEITIESDDRATGIWALEDILWFGPKSQVPGRKVHSFGHLNDTYLKVDGRWKIKDVLISRIRIDQTGD